MTEAITNNVPPVAPPPEQFTIDEKKDSKEVQSLKMKANETLHASQIEVMGNQMRPSVDAAKTIQVPQ